MQRCAIRYSNRTFQQAQTGPYPGGYEPQSARSYGKICKHILSAMTLTIWPHRLTVRTPGFHPGNRSSILREVTKVKISPSWWDFYFGVMFGRYLLNCVRRLVVATYPPATPPSTSTTPATASNSVLLPVSASDPEPLVSSPK